MPNAVAERAKAVSAERAQGASLRVVPIVGPSHEHPRYELLRPETFNAVKVTEISESGSVPTLHVENALDVRVFLMDGQELIGAKQNRILNTDVIVPAHGKLDIPVSCVEQGRWRPVSGQFHHGKSSHHALRRAKAARVHDSLKKGQGHDANQHEVWNEVAACLSMASAESPTSALSDAYAQRETELSTFRSSISMPEEAVGVAVFHGGKFQGLDLFDRHATLKYFWESLMDSYAIDFLSAPVDPSEPNQSGEGDTIRRHLDRAVSGRWENFPSPGEGADWRAGGRAAHRRRADLGGESGHPPATVPEAAGKPPAADAQLSPAHPPPLRLPATGQLTKSGVKGDTKAPGQPWPGAFFIAGCLPDRSNLRYFT